MWVYIQSEPGLFTVGHETATGPKRWHTDSDYGTREAAGARCAFLNGGRLPEPANAAAMATLRRLVVAADDLTDGQLAFDGQSEREFLAAVEAARALDCSTPSTPEPRGIAANADILADIIRESLPSQGGNREWRSGCASACERIAQHVAGILRAGYTGAEIDAWRKRAGIA